ncbi:dienelactone hydrolase [Duganella rhizosphaerae]|uniref:alpha/beta hydrolase family protein n=1 Tax=Duganella rhizosphaerae TaxID=2885763 RepID=UPI0030E78D4E
MKSTVCSALTALAMTLASTCVHAAGFQFGSAADANGKPLAIGIWYPSQATPQSMSVGPAALSVALNGPLQGRALPLVVMSHGAGGSFMEHYDTAIALADAGYVVAAVTHAGDNYADQSRSIYIMDRPRQMSRVIDHMLSSWGGHAAIDPARIGMFGFSSGGFTTLVSIGGLADFSKVGPMCREHPEDFACKVMAKSGQTEIAPPDSSPMQDHRVKAAVVVAPALGFTFSPDGLKNVGTPVQLWRPEDDVILPHPRFAEAVRLALPQAPDYQVVPNAGHFDFLAPCSVAFANMVPAICTSAAGFDRVAFHQTFNKSVVDFFGKNLTRH